MNILEMKISLIFNIIFFKMIQQCCNLLVIQVSKIQLIMKKILTMLFSVLLVQAIAQNTEEKTPAQTETETQNLSENQKRIAELPERIEEAAAAENYQEAANLQEELKTRKKIEVAKSNKDYKRVVELEKELEQCGDCQTQSKSDCSNQRSRLLSCFMPKKKEYTPKRKFSFYADFTPIGYAYQQEEAYYYPNNETNLYSPPSDSHRLLAGHTLGSSIYFGDMSKDFKVGLDIVYISSVMSMEGFNFGNMTFNTSFAKPGIVMTKYFKEGMSGLDMKLNAGTLTGMGNYAGRYWGINASTQIKYWKKRFAIGLEYQYGLGLDYDIDYSQIGITVGMRF